MALRSIFLTIFAAAAASALCGCASLDAEHPLFSTADQIGPAPIQEGIWLAVGTDDCPEANAHRRGNWDRQCVPLEIRRAEDGAWQARWRIDLAPRLSAKDRADAERYGVMRFVLAPATEHPSTDAFSPLYVAEVTQLTADDDSPTYFAIAPIGELPATAMLALDVSCYAILRDGPIDGVTVTYTQPISSTPTQPKLRQASDAAPAPEAPSSEIESCTAHSQGAVREAVRRELIEDVGRDYGQRFVRVRPLDR